MPVIKDEISNLSPTWASTNLGNALISAAEAIEDDEINDTLLLNERQIILISDLQEGSDLDALNTYEWPEKTELIVKPVKAKKTTNAAMQVMASSNYITQSDPNEQLRVRVTNSSDSVIEKFQLSWADFKPLDASEKPESVYVPPGQSVVTDLPAGPNEIAGRKLLLTGDGQEYDNTLYIAPSLGQKINILYLGSDSPENPKQMLYYIEHAFQETSTLNFNINNPSADKALTEKEVKNSRFIIVTDNLKPEQTKLLRQHLESGNTILVAMKSAENASIVSELIAPDNISGEEANVKDYKMLGAIEYEHPVLKPFSDPMFGDFSKIHFWKYRKINLDNTPKARVLARFDNEDPALVEFPVGKGSLLVLTSGWQPSDSQLALSSKFVPLLYSILECGGVLGSRQSQYFIGDTIQIPQAIASNADKIQIRKPDNSLVNLDKGQEVFDQTEQPGFYTVESSAGEQVFAVNLPVQECRTAPLPVEDIEKFGVSYTEPTGKAAEEIEKVKAHQSFVEMESHQKYWRWIFIALCVLLLAEILLGGWLSRPAVLTKGEEK